jgi:hypothetical protein
MGNVGAALLAIFIAGHGVRASIGINRCRAFYGARHLGEDFAAIAKTGKKQQGGLCHSRDGKAERQK